MRLAEFIVANVEPILAEWEVFARGIWPATPEEAPISPARLRDDAEAILRATVADMGTPQTSQQQSDKSRGAGQQDVASLAFDHLSSRHGAERHTEGFALVAVMAEYRALRASVLRLWRESEPTPDENDLDDLTRFNESIDQSLTEAVRGFTVLVDRDREALLAKEQAARQEAESANRAKDIFLATLSHELRGPLNAIVGWTNILRAEGHTEGHVAEGLDVIERNTRMQVQLIQDVLDVSGIVSGKMRLELQRCDLREPTMAAVDAVRPAAHVRDITLDVQLEPETNEIDCDPTRFQQIVWNLVSNAVKFTPKHGWVRVRLASDGTDVTLTVSDNGQGITPAELPHVFERFTQADTGTRRRFSGLGLGLPIVKYLVEMHGGTVEAHSEGENRGATFTVRIPIHAVTHPETNVETVGAGHPEEGSDVPAPRAPVRLDGVRVLVVDDEPDARRILLKVLEGVGADVTVASSAHDALHAITSDAGTFDLLVSDLAMPDQDGYDLIREVRQRGHDATALPAVALTGFARENDAQHAISAGFQRHVAKPVDVHDLTAIMAGLVHRSPGTA